ncbi:unnamed protein product [Ectocarpus sp. 8 AP-2014]
MTSRLAAWQCGLVFLVACFPLQVSSFLFCPTLPSAASRPARASTTTAAAPEGDASTQEGTTATPPPSLDRSAPLSFIAKNNVNFDGDFLSNREGEPTAEELSNENLIKIVAEKSTDEEVNVIVWKCLGYRYDAGEDAWKAVKVFPRWEAMYPEPPDLLGVTRVYEKSVDKPVLKAVQHALARKTRGKRYFPRTNSICLDTSVNEHVTDRSLSHKGPDQGRPFGAQALHRGTAETDRIYRPDAGRANSEQNAQGPGDQLSAVFPRSTLGRSLGRGGAA